MNRNTNGGGGTDSDSRYSSWDRRSQTSNGGHRYYSISSNTLGGGGGGGDPRGSPIPEDPPKILQYARPPENLTSPNRESTLLPTDHSLTHSPDLEKKVEKERRSLERRQQQQQQQQGSNKAPKRGDTAASSLSTKSSVISSLRNSFRNRSSRSRKTSAPLPISTPVSPSDGPPSIHLPTRKLSSSSAGGGGGGGRYTPTSRSGSINSFRGNNAGSWSVAARNTTATTTQLLLPGRAASPGRPVQVVAPFIPEEGDPESAEMRDPTLLQQQRLSNNNNHPVMETAARTSAATAAGAGAPTAPVRQQRCLPQTPKQASRTGLTSAPGGGSGGSRATAKVSAVVPPTQHAAATAPSSTAAPRPAQRLSLRHKVGKWGRDKIHGGRRKTGKERTN